MHLVLTSNGPGEFSGWVRPLLHELYAREPHAEVTIFFVPDDYATGREADVAQAMFPTLRVYRPTEYTRFALGATLSPPPRPADRVQYLGGDLMHAARVHQRLGGTATAYKFSRKRYARLFERVFAVDEANRKQLERWAVPAERIQVLGNLAIDGALLEAAGAFADRHDPQGMLPEGGIAIMPGSRKGEVAHAVPFFAAVASSIRRRSPELPVVFAVSAFTSDADLADALAKGGHPRAYGTRGTVVSENGRSAIRPEGTDMRFPIVRNGLQAASRAQVVVTLPGTKAIELAALGIPAIVCVPYNAPEVAVINGVFQYVDRIPFVGIALKRAAALAVVRRFKRLAQPNIDAGRELHPELRGTLTPGRVASVALRYHRDAAWRERTSADLRALYASHVGAAGRLADALLGRPVVKAEG